MQYLPNTAIYENEVVYDFTVDRSSNQSSNYKDGNPAPNDHWSFRKLETMCLVLRPMTNRVSLKRTMDMTKMIMVIIFV